MPVKHLTIHFFTCFFIFSLRRSLVPILSINCAKGGVHRKSVTGSCRGKHTLTLMDGFDLPSNLTCMFMVFGRKPEYLEKLYVCMQTPPRTVPGQDLIQQPSCATS